ncbi:hypothetical protein BDV26DRAFT_163049 [Aspergillus bertholletiae]|uniref:Uncharacterized protein n=1 Tax=Aspergillus bertholletiae TaxID=1226010 RepID=A0A5N7BD37_9EURO|nr:hypothetical protein BDV26DRAFT_163049 [Aspergillus bertholletiae]
MISKSRHLFLGEYLAREYHSDKGPQASDTDVGARSQRLTHRLTMCNIRLSLELAAVDNVAPGGLWPRPATLRRLIYGPFLLSTKALTMGFIRVVLSEAGRSFILAFGKTIQAFKDFIHWLCMLNGDRTTSIRGGCADHLSSPWCDFLSERVQFFGLAGAERIGVGSSSFFHLIFLARQYMEHVMRGRSLH